MAHTKAGSTTKLGRDSAGRRLGVKLYGGQLVKTGDILVRQRGQKIIAGLGTAVGKDETIFAQTAGQVVFQTKKITRFTGLKQRRTTVTVQPVEK